MKLRLLIIRRQLKTLVDGIISTDSPRVSVRVLVFGIAFIAGIKVLYAACYFFASSFHHTGLSALALLFFLGFTGAVCLLVLPFIARILETGVLRSKALSTVLRRPAASIFFVLGALSGAVLPPLLAGPHANGPFRFIGLVRLDRSAFAAAMTLLVLLFVASLLIIIASCFQHRGKE